jgi:hypothetical protein
VGKTQIGELFFKERMLQLPSPWPARLKLTISEKHLRLLITGLITLFLLVLGSALFLQLLQSRASHLSEQNRLSVLYGKAAAQGIAMTFGQITSPGQTAPALTSDALLGFVAPDGLSESRVFAVANAAGLIIAAQPSAAGLEGKNITSVLPPDFVTSTPIS